MNSNLTFHRITGDSSYEDLIDFSRLFIAHTNETQPLVFRYANDKIIEEAALWTMNKWSEEVFLLLKDKNGKSI